MSLASADVDVLIVGGGPAGAIAAAFLAPHADVMVLEREHFPRFHIGESLLPVCLPVLADLGVDLAQAGHRFKAGARFHDERHGDRRTYLFADGLDGPLPDHAFHVERSTFDTQLIDLARTRGARVRHGVRVRSLDLRSHLVQVETDDCRYRARYVVDASGQKALLARHFKSMVPLRGFGHASVFGHFRGLTDRALDLVGPDGNVEVLRVGGGWGWAIPLSERKLSVGVVSRQGPANEDLLVKTIEQSSLLRDLTAGAIRTGSHSIADYSYRNERSFGARYCCVGDAAGFLDPVFSSGVAIALHGARAMADLLIPALAAREEHCPDLMQPWAKIMATAYRCFFALIHRFYQSAMMDNLFFAPDPEPRLRSGLITMLAGDVWREDNEFQSLVLTSSRHSADFPADW